MKKKGAGESLRPVKTTCFFQSEPGVNGFLPHSGFTHFFQNINAYSMHLI